VGGAVAWVAVKSDGGVSMVVAAADGEGAALVGASVPTSTSIAARAMAEGRTMIIDDMSAETTVLEEARRLDLGAGLYVPMQAEDGPVGALVVARLHGSDRFSGPEINAAEIFASAAAIVVALGAARRTLEENRLVSEHERIARDLHDTVIQRLFALGMGLQAVERMPGGSIVERVRESVDELDQVIREIRETIFDLNRSPSDELDLRQQMRQVAQEAAGHLGFVPRLGFRGPVDLAVTDDVLPHLLSVLRESLANVGRHAKATQVDVVVVAADGSITLNVSDDGIGIGGTPSAGHGTANMASRAADLGGEMTLTRRIPSGTLLQWRVPRRPAQGD
jgi:signal transduction histidine kinase